MQRNHAASISVEAELLLRCSRTGIAEGQHPVLRDLSHQVRNWDWFLRAARSGGTAPMVYRNLSSTAILPAAVEAELRTFYIANAMRGDILSEELARVGRILDEACIEFIPYKGPALALQAYGAIACRQFEDLDLFLRERDIETAGTALMTRGYRPNRDRGQPVRWPPTNRDALVEVQFTDPSGCFLIELQSQFTSSWMACEFDYDGLWERLSTITIGNVAMRALSLEDLLLVLCIHATKHCWERLEWACNIAELLRNAQDVAWAALLHRAGVAGTTRILLLGLELARSLYDAPLPPPVSDLIKADPAVRLLARDATRWLLHHEVPATAVERIAFSVLVKHGWRSRLEALAPVATHYISLVLLHPSRPRGVALRSLAIVREMYARLAVLGVGKPKEEPTQP